MKKKTAGILLGILLASVSLAGCGENEATEAASESAQTEGEGSGEITEDGEKTQHCCIIKKQYTGAWDLTPRPAYCFLYTNAVF